jgi:hypothetical protein
MASKVRCIVTICAPIKSKVALSEMITNLIMETISINDKFHFISIDWLGFTRDLHIFLCTTISDDWSRTLIFRLQFSAWCITLICSFLSISQVPIFFRLWLRKAPHNTYSKRGTQQERWLESVHIAKVISKNADVIVNYNACLCVEGVVSCPWMQIFGIDLSYLGIIYRGVSQINMFK